MCVNNKVIQNIILFLFFIFPLIKTLPNFEESLEKNGMNILYSII